MISYVSTKREYLPKFLKKLKKLKEEPIFSNSEIVGKKTYYEDHGISLVVERYYNLNNLCVIRTNSKNYNPEKGLIEVSDTFTQENILSGFIKVPNFILEGTDGIGKTTTIEGLLSDGIVCFDRELDNICKYMLFDVPMEVRIKNYKEYLEKAKEKILFLVNRDEEEIRRRIFSRDVITEFDRYAVEYNKMYYETFKEMEKRGYLYDRLFMLDCTGLSIPEQKEQVKKLVIR